MLHPHDPANCDLLVAKVLQQLSKIEHPALLLGNTSQLAYARACLQALKILSRVSSALTALGCQDSLQILLAWAAVASESIDMEAAALEAQKTMFNVLLQSQLARQALSQGHHLLVLLDQAVGRPASLSASRHEWMLRLLFVVLAQEPAAVAKVQAADGAVPRLLDQLQVCLRTLRAHCCQTDIVSILAAMVPEGLGPTAT